MRGAARDLSSGNMTKIHAGRFTAETREPLVVFIIGLRFNRLLSVVKWLPAFAAMPKMLKQLYAERDSGLLHHETMIYWRGVATVQYWRSFEKLERFAKDPGRSHLPAWRAFNRAITDNASVGVWHETYLVPPNSYECVYVNMPRFGLARAATHRPVDRDRDSARQRMGAGSSSG